MSVRTRKGITMRMRAMVIRITKRMTRMMTRMRSSIRMRMKIRLRLMRMRT